MAPIPPVRIYAAEHPALAHTLRAQLEEQRRKELENFCYCADSVQFYVQKGLLKGIELAITMCGEVEKKLNEPNR